MLPDLDLSKSESDNNLYNVRFDPQQSQNVTQDQFNVGSLRAKCI